MRRIWIVFAVMIMLAWGSCALAAGPYSVTVPEGSGLIDGNGDFLIEPGRYDEIITIEPGMVYLAGEKGNYHILDCEGEIISEQVVSMARYTDDVIIFRCIGLYGAMDLAGGVVVEPRWTQLVTNGEGGYLALEDYAFDNVADEIIYIDPAGEIIRTGNHTVGTLGDVMSGRMPYMTTDGSYGLVDARGEIITPARWLYAGEFKNGVCTVSDKNGMGLVNTQGEAVLPCEYAHLDRNDDLVIALNQEGILEVYTGDGAVQLFALEAGNKSVSLAGSCVALADESGVSLYNRQGIPIYSGSRLAGFSEGLNGQIIASDGKWGEACVWLMDQSGNALSGKYQRILPLCGSRYAFLTMTGATYFSGALNDLQKSWNYESVRYGMIDGTGNEILDGQYLEILALDGNRFILESETGVYLSDESGFVIQSWLLPETD